VDQVTEGAASALAGSRELLEAVLANLSDGIVVGSASGERVYANDEAARLTGYATAEELLAAPRDEVWTRFQIVDEDGVPLTPSQLPGRRALAGDDDSGPKLVHFRSRATGETRVSEVRAVAVRDEHGEPLYVISLFREVTAQHRLVEEQTQASEEYARLYREAERTSALLDALYDSAPIGLGFWDRELRYVRVNEALAKVNERSPEDHIGRLFSEVVPQLAHVLEPIARRVLETREPIVALEVAAGTPNNPEAPRHWLASYYPVLAPDGDVIGIGAVVEEITERRRAEQRNELQFAVTRILADADSAESAVPRILRTLCERLDWDVASYWSTDPDAPRVTWAQESAQVEGFVAMTERAVLGPALLPGRVAASGRAEWVEEIAPDATTRASVAAAEGLRSGVAFPVSAGGEVVGVVEAFARAVRPADPELLETFAALGAQLGQFLRRRHAEDERMLLLQRERQARSEAEAAAATLRKLQRVSEATLAHLTLQDLLHALLARIVEVLDADTAAILLVGSDGHLHVRATVGLEDEIERAIAVPLGEGMSGRVAATQSPLLVPDVAQIELVSPVLRERGINSIVAIPLIAEKRVIGVVHAGSEAYAQFTEEDARLLELIADRITLAINQAALHEAERAAHERLQFLGEASTVLASSLDVDATLAQMARLAVPHFADWCAVDVVGADGSLARVASVGLPPGESQQAASMVVPLAVRAQSFGELTFARADRARGFDEHDTQLALELAARAAVAVDNARLYRAAEERAQAARVLASVGDGVFLVDRNGVVRTWNRAAEAATGIRAAEIVDRLAAEAIPGWAAIVSRIPIVAVGSAAQRVESLPLEVGSRELWLSIHGVTVPDGIVYAFRDLTEERALETMRTEFVSTVSHELRTPLAAIYGAAMTLRRGDVALDEGQRATLLDVVSGEADRLARTVNDILWASRLDTDSLHVTIQNCDPVQLVRDVVEAQRAHLDRAHELELDVEDGLPPVSGDPDKVGRVLINLVDNAVKYSPDGGRVDVSVRLLGSRVRFSVTDQGLGVPAAEHRRIFEKFYRLDPNMNRGVGGTGLGLYICRELVRRMDGRIWVDSRGLGRGSAFHVELPVAGDFTAHLA
jgi:signal transduction histidine kinase/putative methionine-R-sulfoxide reductase with GAF domain